MFSFGYSQKKMKKKKSNSNEWTTLLRFALGYAKVLACYCHLLGLHYFSEVIIDLLFIWSSLWSIKRFKKHAWKLASPSCLLEWGSTIFKSLEFDLLLHLLAQQLRFCPMKLCQVIADMGSKTSFLFLLC